MLTNKHLTVSDIKNHSKNGTFNSKKHHEKFIPAKLQINQNGVILMCLFFHSKKIHVHLIYNLIIAWVLFLNR